MAFPSPEGQPPAVRPSDRAGYGNHPRERKCGYCPWDVSQYPQTSRDQAVSYTIIVEQTPTGYSAYLRDLPGVGAAARTLDEIKRLTVEAIQFHLESCGVNRPTGFGPTDEPRFIIVNGSEIRSCRGGS